MKTRIEEGAMHVMAMNVSSRRSDEERDDRWVPPVIETKENGLLRREADGWGRAVREREEGVG